MTFKSVFQCERKVSGGQNRLLLALTPAVPAVPATPDGHTVKAGRLGG